MARRVHVHAVKSGDILLSASESHHLQDVLRMGDGDTVELFDNTGAIAQAVLRIEGQQVVAGVTEILTAQQHRPIVIASAMPKGNRADWMIEKLSELAVSTFIPLVAERSVVLAEGKNKLERWKRLAMEAAKQSHRAGVMQIRPVQPLTELLASKPRDEIWWQLSTYAESRPIGHMLVELNEPANSLTLCIGPEGGWSAQENAAFQAAHMPTVSLGKTILRIETAAIAAAAILMMHLDAV